MKIALCSLDIVWESPHANLAQCIEKMQIAAEHHARLVIFPEMTATGFSVTNPHIAKTPGLSEFEQGIKAKAKELNICCLFGTVVGQQDMLLNRALCVDGQGEVIGQYDKSHLFSFADEHKLFSSDNQLCVTDLDEAKIGLSICYDLRFAELYRAYTLAGCNVLVNIANWPARRVMHWRTLLKARAIENLCYMIGVNRTGEDGSGLSYEQSSDVITPQGEVLEPMATVDNVALYQLDLAGVAQYREQFPALNDIYQKHYDYGV